MESLMQRTYGIFGDKVEDMKGLWERVCYLTNFWVSLTAAFKESRCSQLVDIDKFSRLSFSLFLSLEDSMI